MIASHEVQSIGSSTIAAAVLAIVTCEFINSSHFLPAVSKAAIQNVRGLDRERAQICNCN